MRKRIFIAINLPEDIKNKIVEIQKRFSDLPVRFTKKNSLHLTIYFIGYVDDERMVRVCQIVKEVAKNHEPFFIKFNRLCLAPPGKLPRLIWLEGEKNQELSNLKNDIENVIYSRQNDKRIFFKIEKDSKNFIPHITLARIKQHEWKKLSTKPIIDEEIILSLPVSSIEVMESDLKRDGAEYIVLESAALGE